MSDYFDEFKMGLDNAYKVVQTVWKLFEGQASTVTVGVGS